LKNTDVLILSTAFEENTTGYRRLTYFTKYLRLRGLQVSCMGFWGITKFGIIKPSRECYRLPLFVLTRHALLNLILNIILSLLETIVILILRPRIVILSVPEAYPVIATYLGCLLAKSRIIIDVRDPQEELIAYKYRQGFLGLIAKIFKKINYSIYKRVDAVTTVTKTLARMLVKEIRRPIHLVPNGADLEFFVPISKRRARELLGLNQDSFLVAYIGALTIRGHYYNVLPVLKAIRKARERVNIDIKLVAAGPMYYSEKIIEEFKDVLHYMGVLNLNSVVALLSACDVGIIPRIKDPIYDYAISVKMYEYIATGLPVIAIASKESELAKMLKENKLGFICEPEDQAYLENLIVALATDKNLLNKLRKNVFVFRKFIDRRIGAERLFRLLIRISNRD